MIVGSEERDSFSNILLRKMFGCVLFHSQETASLKSELWFGSESMMAWKR